MQLYLIRHGQSTNNANWTGIDERYDRTSDPALTTLGIRQAQTLADFIASCRTSSDQTTSVGADRHGIRFTHLYSSLMIRAIHTGTILSKTLGIPLYALPEAHENGGIYLETLVEGDPQISIEYGVTPVYLQEHFPELKFHQPVPERGWWQGGMEPATGRMLRAISVLQILKERHLATNDKVAVVTHGGFFNTLARAMLNIRPDEPDNTNLPTWFSYCNCAVSRFDFEENRVVLKYHNRTDFLGNDLVTC